MCIDLSVLHLVLKVVRAHGFDERQGQLRESELLQKSL